MMKKIYSKLYKYNSKGQLQQWEVIVDGSQLYTKEGIHGGKITKSKPTLCECKNKGRSNETSPYEQAYREAQSRWTKKTEEGYRETIKELKHSKRFEVMLAKKYQIYKDKIQFPVFVQPKLDGIRCYITKDGAFSRKHKRFYSIPHILDSLKPVFEKYPDLVLDGELYNHTLKDDFNKITSLVKKQKFTTKELEESKRLLEYHIYDCFESPVEEAKFCSRLIDYQEITENLSYIKNVPTTEAKDMSVIDVLHGMFTRAGYEGSIIRQDVPYYQGRSTALLKYKDFIDGEYLVEDITQGRGQRFGMAGKVWLKDIKSGEKFEADFTNMGGHEAYKEILENKDKYIGKMATVVYKNLTPRGVPRHGKVKAIARDYE